MRGQPHEGLRRLVSTMASMSSRDGPLGPGFCLYSEEKRRRYFLFLRVLWRFHRVEDFRTIAERRRREGFMNKEHNPATNRSVTRRFGARFRERFRISSCCLRRTDSATTERTPLEDKGLVFFYGEYECWRYERTYQPLHTGGGRSRDL